MSTRRQAGQAGTRGDTRKDTRIVALGNASRRELNLAVRQELKANGSLAPEDHTFRVLAYDWIARMHPVSPGIPRRSIAGSHRKSARAGFGTSRFGRNSSCARLGVSP